ncbi:uncharacterized protein DUF4783 [Roseivirga ehrenbergii]|uniref:DUF4783 domain-containing protein n=1 Tax=Roseivirga ehrenbergii (strain DSM 102268 / JCM 13514 / KCTC 12282 / NCIMB 14502 / KMM 6017) TaxID=279360 RepID=A0A150XIT4_ROSEK|nr:DUF4783 domain-containing protein [Roseivirga ehrenbergii]KYG78562.1 hypothetical protein MB14_17680 [Roseivirga ehrenbergii]TCL10469.1 uncharacterized protein DUF4783 [Roseivirga ehrenbergii]
MAKSLKMRNKNIVITFMSLLLVFSTFSGFAQTPEEKLIKNVQEALKSSSSRELVKYLHERVEIKLDNEKKDYSTNQAEIVLKQFFQKNPADSTEFIHEGNSDGGIIYAIGSYVSRNKKYRVVLRAKKYKADYKIYRLEFTEDR